MEVDCGGGGGASVAWSHESGIASPMQWSNNGARSRCTSSGLDWSLDMLNLMARPTNDQSPQCETTPKKNPIVFFVDRSD